jgi:hypothetical protein
MYVYAWGGSSLNESGVPGLTADVAIVADVVPKLTKVKADVGSAAWSDKSPVYSGGTAVDAPLATPLFVEGYVVMPIRLAVQNISSVTVGKGDGTGVEVPLRGGNSILLLVLDESGILAHAVAKRPVSIAADVGWTLASDAFYYVKANGTPVITGEFPTGIDTQVDGVEICDALLALGVGNCNKLDRVARTHVRCMNHGTDEHRGGSKEPLLCQGSRCRRVFCTLRCLVTSAKAHERTEQW